MTQEPEDEIATYLNDGWDIAGYSVCMLAAGATAQYILLRKGNSLATCTVLINGANELGRGVNILTPKTTPPRKKGFFG